jgi:ribosome biogenesis GTPase
MHKGTVIRSTGSWYEVEREDGSIVSCRIAGKLRLGDLKLTNPIGVGDRVGFEMEDSGSGFIKKVEPRKNYVIRQSPRKKHQLHLLAANIDQAMLVVTIAQPQLKQGFIDRFLLMTEPYEIPVIIVFNKKDVYSEETLETYDALKHLYEGIGYKVLLVSAEKDENVEEIKALLKDKVTLVSGQSGVGKSTLINRIQPGLELKTDDISDYTGKGQHTTTFAEMFSLDFGGKIIDTPGIKTLSFNHLEVMDVAHNFREFFALSSSCKFANCTHLNEPGCAVKAGLETGEIHPWRYANYLQLVEEVEDQNYWERHKNY